MGPDAGKAGSCSAVENWSDAASGCEIGPELDAGVTFVALLKLSAVAVADGVKMLLCVVCASCDRKSSYINISLSFIVDIFFSSCTLSLILSSLTSQYGTLSRSSLIDVILVLVIEAICVVRTLLSSLTLSVWLECRFDLVYCKKKMGIMRFHHSYRTDLV